MLPLSLSLSLSLSCALSLVELTELARGPVRLSHHNGLGRDCTCALECAVVVVVTANALLFFGAIGPIEFERLLVVSLPRPALPIGHSRTTRGYLSITISDTSHLQFRTKTRTKQPEQMVLVIMMMVK